MQHDFALGHEKENVESDENQLGGSRPVKRYTIVAGRFTVTDFFDNNRYTHDPRTQFMGWGVMYNGAWDYPADTRGYTWGWVHEFHTLHWSFRYASAAEPKVANGLRFDRRLFRDRGDVVRRRRLATNGTAIRAPCGCSAISITPIRAIMPKRSQSGGRNGHHAGRQRRLGESAR